MEKDPSPLDTLRQLKELLDAGNITPQEFEALKSKLIFGSPAPPMPPAPEPTVNSEASVLLPPVEDPMLPPLVPPPTAQPSLPVASSHSDQPDGLEDAAPDPVFAAEPRNQLSTVLIVGGVVVLLALMAYLLLGNRASERLTSTSQTAADSLAVQPEVGPQADQIELPPVTVPETVRVAPALPPVATPALTTDSVTTVAPTPSAADEATARNRVQQALTAYYEDLQAAPFDATAHFAPSVERFYTLQNTTPAAINDDLTASHFPEFSEEQTQVAPGSLKLEPAAADGTRTANYLEKSTSFRQSRQQHQQTTAQVRVRFDKNYKIVYLRQERLLENTFTD